MSRKLLITIHLYLAAFFAPVLIVTAISGGLYLLGEKGNSVEVVIYSGSANEFDTKATDMTIEVSNLMQKLGVESNFESVVGRGNVFFTRPTSREYFVFEIKEDKLEVIKNSPNLIESIIELHKGHGPKIYRFFQKILAVGLLFIVVSGLWLGLSSPMLRNKSLLASSLGGLIFLLLALV